MADIRNKVQSLDPNVQPRDLEQMVEKTGNIYETLAIIAKRAKHLSVDIKQELKQKLEEFAVSSDIIEEISENKEQIEISKFYEKLPNAVLISLNEYLEDELYYTYKEKKNIEE